MVVTAKHQALTPIIRRFCCLRIVITDKQRFHILHGKQEFLI